MTENNIWAGLFQSQRHIESIKVDLEMAYSFRDQEVVNIYKNGVPVAEIARRAQLSEPTIHKILKQQGAK